MTAHDRLWRAIRDSLTGPARTEARRIAQVWAMTGTQWDECLTADEAWDEYGPSVVQTSPHLLRAGLRALTPPNVTYFASGTHDGDALRAFAHLGIAPGVAVPELTEDAWAVIEPDLRPLREDDFTAFFADSGAYSEARSGREITDAMWRKRLAVYDRLVAALWDTWRFCAHRQVRARFVPVYVVAPDCVRDQRATLRRLATHADAVRALARRGARVIVPVQRGRADPYSLAAFWRKELAVLGPGDWIAGVPCHEGVTCPQAFALFAREARPAAVHFLGLGPTRHSFPAFLRTAQEIGAAVSCDSVLLRRLAGKTNGPGGGPRAVQARRNEAARFGQAYATFAAILLGVRDELAHEELQLALSLTDTLTAPPAPRRAA